MFLHHLVEFANNPNFQLMHKWHGINVLMVLECLILLAVLWAGIALLATIKGKRKLKFVSIFTSIFFATAAYAANTSLSNLSASGAIAAANLIYVVQTGGSGGVKATFTQVATFINSLFSGDFTVAAGGAATLATVNANVGSFGSATNCTAFTTNAKGLITAASQTTCTPAIASITGLGTGVATALAVNVGTAGSIVVNGGALGTPSSGVATNLTGTAAGLTAGNVTTNANLTGMITSIGNAASLGSFTSANLRTALTDETGSGGAAVFATAPTIDSLTASTAMTLSFLTGGGTQCMTVSNTGVVGATACSGGGSVTTLTPGAGLVSGVTASCTQTNITVTGTLSNARCINAQTGTTYTVLDTDRSKQVTLSNAAAIAVTLPQAGAASAFANGWFSTFTNVGTGTATFTPTTSTINGAATYRLFAGQSITITSDGTNYQIDPGTTGGIVISTQSGANYAFVVSDFGKLINLSNGSNQIPTIGVASAAGANWFVNVCNIGAGTQTLTPTTSTINGAATFIFPAASAARPACATIVSDGTNYSAAPDFPMDASMFSAGTLAVARGGTGITSLGTGVATAMGNDVNTNGGFVTASTASIASNAIVTGAGSGTAVTGTTPGTGVLTAITTNLSAAGGLSTTVASGTSSLGTSAISSAACATVVTTSATNTATTDVVWWGFNGDPTAVTGYVPLVSGMLTIIAYPTANNVNFKVCNNTNASITPGAITLNWRIVR